MVVTCNALDYQGMGVCKEDRVYFVKNLLPGEKAIIKIIEDFKTYAIGEVVEYLLVSENRQAKEPLSYAPMYHLKDEEELVYQENLTKETFKKIANIDVSLSKTITDNVFNHYKNKVTLQVKKINGFLQIGTYKAKSHTLEPISNHILADEKINKVISELVGIFNTEKLKDESLIKIQIQSGDEVLVTFFTDGKWQEIKHFLVLNYNLIQSTQKKRYVLKGNGFIPLHFMGIDFKLYTNTFFQTNYFVAEKMFEAIQHELQGVVVDAYAGAATIGMIISPYVDYVYSIENNASSVQSAREAVKCNEIKNLEIIFGNVEEHLLNLTFDTIVFDPPRRGLNKTIIDVLLKKKPSKIVYISCNVRTLARDVGLLKETYVIDKVIPVKMYPKTVETETIVILSKM